MVGNIIKAIRDLFLGLIQVVGNSLMYTIYAIYWAIIKGLSLLITIIEKAFFVFAGAQEIGFRPGLTNTNQGIILDAFINNTQIFNAYLRLSLIAFVVMLILAIMKIIKQDYIDKEGPRSKGPIFRSLVISFILYVSVPPLFMILIRVSAFLTLAVLRAMGGGQEYIADILLKNSFGWKFGIPDGNGLESAEPWQALYGNTTTFFNVTVDHMFYSNYYMKRYGHSLNNELKTYTAKYYYGGVEEEFTFKRLYSFSSDIWPLENTKIHSGKSTTYMSKLINGVEFYWYTYFIGAFVVIGTLFDMVMAMIGRIYRIVILYVVAPAPISQIVMDGGRKFAKWKDSTIGEFLKTVSAMLTFMVFLIMIGTVNKLRFDVIVDIGSVTSYIETGGAIIFGGSGVSHTLASSVARVGSLSSALRFVFDATMKVFFIMAGARVLKEVDPLVNELISGVGTRSMKDDAASGGLTAGKLAAGAIGGVTNVASKVAKAGMEVKQSSTQKKERAAQVEEATRQEMEKRSQGLGGGGDGDGGGGSGGGSGAAQTPTGGSEELDEEAKETVGGGGDGGGGDGGDGGQDDGAENLGGGQDDEIKQPDGGLDEEVKQPDGGGGEGDEVEELGGDQGGEEGQAAGGKELGWIERVAHGGVGLAKKAGKGIAKFATKTAPGAVSNLAKRAGAGTKKLAKKAKEQVMKTKVGRGLAKIGKGIGKVGKFAYKEAIRPLARLTKGIAKVGWKYGVKPAWKYAAKPVLTTTLKTTGKVVASTAKGAGKKVLSLSSSGKEALGNFKEMGGMLDKNKQTRMKNQDRLAVNTNVKQQMMAKYTDESANNRKAVENTEKAVEENNNAKNQVTEAEEKVEESTENFEDKSRAEALAKADLDRAQAQLDAVNKVYGNKNATPEILADAPRQIKNAKNFYRRKFGDYKKTVGATAEAKKQLKTDQDELITRKRKQSETQKREDTSKRNLENSNKNIDRIRDNIADLDANRERIRRDQKNRITRNS